jgi:hypothetical protein
MTTHQLVIDHLAPAATIAGNISKRLPRHVDSQALYKDACVGLIREVRP